MSIKYLFVFILLLCTNRAWPQADLSLEVSASHTQVDLGQTVIFTIEVLNSGPETTSKVDVSAILPSGYGFVDAVVTGEGRYDPVSGIWNAGGIGYGATDRLRLEARVMNTTDLTFLAEVVFNQLMDPDSIPNNGVDTDGDGNTVDDPGDEDDGDGQMVIVAGVSTSSGSPPRGGTASGAIDCLAPMNELSSMAPNPESTEGTFKFDYKINAVFNFEMANTVGFSPEYSRGNPTQLKMEYYVNSSDGSMLFPGGLFGFFKTNFKYYNRLGRVDGAIWLANGQIVVYGYDAKEKRNVAITRESIQTAEGKLGSDYFNMMQFFSSSEELAEHANPLPAHVQWDGTVQGYKGKLIEGTTGIENTWNIYFDTAPTPIKTSCIMMGFMVGVLKDARESKCNRLVVYNKVDIGGEGSGDGMETELLSIRPMGISFDGSPYKPLTLGGDYGTAALANMDDYERKMRSIEFRRRNLEREKDHCMGMEFCIKEKEEQLEELKVEKSQAICEQMVKMGMENTFSECMKKELEGY